MTLTIPTPERFSTSTPEVDESLAELLTEALEIAVMEGSQELNGILPIGACALLAIIEQQHSV